MNAIVIKTAGKLTNPRLIYNGFMAVNPTGAPLEGTSYYFHIYMRDDNATDMLMKCYGGEIITSIYATLVESKTVDGVVENLYKIRVKDYYDDDPGTNPVIGLQTKSGVTRVDFYTDGKFDIKIDNFYSSNYGNPFIIYAEQLNYSDIPEGSRVLFVKNAIGTIYTSWFNESTTFEEIQLGGKADVVGTIMDFVNCWEHLARTVFSGASKMNGRMSDFLNALKAKGVRNRDISFNNGESGIINDVSSSQTFTATFNLSGTWTVTDPLP